MGQDRRWLWQKTGKYDCRLALMIGPFIYDLANDLANDLASVLFGFSSKARNAEDNPEVMARLPAHWRGN